MANIVAKKFVIRHHFEGVPKEDDLDIVKEEIRDLGNGEFLAEAEFLSVDPYMRKYSLEQSIGATMMGSQVARVIKSNNPNWPVGQRLHGYMGWRTHTIMHPEMFSEFSLNGRMPYKLPSYFKEDVSPHLALGILGQTGLTAYFGLTEILKPKKGETVVVSGAGGAVGHLVGQIAKKVYGCTVIGFTSSEFKCSIVRTLGFDEVIVYSAEDVAEQLRRAAPKGIDCYFDNVGGELSSTVMYQMNDFGRVAVCGAVSSYNREPNDMPKCTLVQPPILSKQLTVQGFLVSRWDYRKMEGFDQLYKWMKEGKIEHRESIIDGFEAMYVAFTNMLRGDSLGKSVVRIVGDLDLEEVRRAQAAPKNYAYSSDSTESDSGEASTSNVNLSMDKDP